MGPEGGAGGGTVIAEGTPEQVADLAHSYTGRFLRHVLDGHLAAASAG
jgi:excinuclease ABC subunit A